jgi:hypothetical protein
MYHVTTGAAPLAFSKFALTVASPPLSELKEYWLNTAVETILA